MLHSLVRLALHYCQDIDNSLGFYALNPEVWLRAQGLGFRVQV